MLELPIAIGARVGERLYWPRPGTSAIFSVVWRVHFNPVIGSPAVSCSTGNVVDLVDALHALIRGQLAAEGHGKSREAAQKDLHLVEATLATDHAVVSLDEIAHEDLVIEATAKIM
jgi:hypothetical protein